jgi:hypothetical protein
MDDLIPIEDPTTGGCDFGKKSFLSGVRDTRFPILDVILSRNGIPFRDKDLPNCRYRLFHFSLHFTGMVEDPFGMTTTNIEHPIYIHLNFCFPYK